MIPGSGSSIERRLLKRPVVFRIGRPLALIFLAPLSTLALFTSFGVEAFFSPLVSYF